MKRGTRWLPWGIGLTSFVLLLLLCAFVTSFFVEITYRQIFSDDQHSEYGVRLVDGSLVFARRYHHDEVAVGGVTSGFDPLEWGAPPLDVAQNLSFLADSYVVHGDRYIRKPVTHWGAAGFAYQTSSIQEYRLMVHRWPNIAYPVIYPTDSWALLIPLWPAMIVVAGFEIILVRRSVLRYWRIRRGKCPVCGFDLRASLGRCPECGTPLIGYLTSAG
jgi:hypothetical protein